jgi:hypothetical protein
VSKGTLCMERAEVSMQGALAFANVLRVGHWTYASIMSKQAIHIRFVVVSFDTPPSVAIFQESSRGDLGISLLVSRSALPLAWAKRMLLFSRTLSRGNLGIIRPTRG